jgi:Type VI secretion system/phage-baseplate injector OB domain
MSATEDFLNLIHREIMATMDRMTRRQPGIVDSYDPETHAVKLKLMPDSGPGEEPVITGWIPLHTMQTGNGAGWHSPPNIGDPGWIEFHEFDREGGTFQQATFNDQFPPDKTVQAGENKYIHPKTKTTIYFDNDGNITITGMSGGGQDNSKQTIVLKQDGSTSFTDKAGQSVIMNGTDTITITDAAGDTVVMNGGTITLTSNSVVNVVSPHVNLGASSGTVPVALTTGPATKVFGI